jgi:hypothetical protein
MDNRLRRSIDHGDTAGMRKTLAIVFWLVLGSPLAAAEGAVQTQRDLIDAQIAGFPAGAGDQGRMFFVGFAGYGEERVFAEEIKLAAQVVGEKFGSTERSVLLVNDRRDLTAYPFASASSLRYALEAVANVMNREDDVLFLALSSHGSPDATIEVTNTGMKEQNLGAKTLAGILAESGIRWKVIVVSACYSGRFVKPLADNHTIVLAASAKNRTSFGCSDTRDLTYFGEAFYRDALPGALSLRDAFDEARRAIHTREQVEGYKPSQPQSYFGPMMESKLVEMQQAR